MEKKVSIIKLFQEKKYSEVIFLIENKVPENQKNSSVLNLLGVSRILKGKLNKEDFLTRLENVVETQSDILMQEAENHEVYRKSG